MSDLTTAEVLAARRRLAAEYHDQVDELGATFLRRLHNAGVVTKGAARAMREAEVLPILGIDRPCLSTMELHAFEWARSHLAESSGCGTCSGSGRLPYPAAGSRAMGACPACLGRGVR